MAHSDTRETFAPPTSWRSESPTEPHRPASLVASAHELRERGFDILEQDARQLRAVRRQLHGDLLTRIQVVVWLKRVDTVDAATIQHDRADLDRWTDQSDFTSPFPTRLTLLGYLAERVTPDARAQIALGPRMGFGRFTSVGARDSEGVYVFRRRRLVGLAFFPLVNFLTLTLLAPQPGDEPRVVWVWALILTIGTLPLVGTALWILSVLSRTW